MASHVLWRGVTSLFAYDFATLSTIIRWLRNFAQLMASEFSSKVL